MEQDLKIYQKTDNDLAREYFEPLTYDDISKSDWRELIAILERHLQKRNEIELKRFEETGVRDYVYEIDKCTWVKPTKTKPFAAYIKVKCDNYSIREGISFNPDGFIGFAGWASTYNTKPFTDAFREWVDIMKGKTPLKSKLERILELVENSTDEELKEKVRNL